MHTRLWVPVLVGSVLSVAVYAWAASPTDQLRAYTDQVLKVVENSAITLPERRTAVRKIVAEVFDVSETAKRALGPHWALRTPAEREEFVKRFAGLLEQTYIARMGEYGGEQITYVGEQIDGDRAIVRARITTKKGSEVPVESRLLQKEDRWLIYDVLDENISLIASYRAQFDRIIRTASYEDLVKRLRNQSELLNEKEAGAQRTKMPAGR